MVFKAKRSKKTHAGIVRENDTARVCVFVKGQCVRNIGTFMTEHSAKAIMDATNKDKKFLKQVERDSGF